MAEQRPYRVPGSATDARLMRVKCVAVLSLASAFIAINWATTQHAARVLRDAPWLGQPLFHLPEIGALYAPWAWVAWWIKWHNAPALAPLWMLCIREALYPVAAIGAIAIGAIALARVGLDTGASDLHGSARWATMRDLEAARLIDRRGSILRALVPRLRVKRPLAPRAAVYLGVWKRFGRRSLIRDRGHTHVLVVGPTQSGKGSAIVIPTLLTWPHSVLVHDVKSENWALTAGARKRLGHLCLKFEPASPEPSRARFNPLAEVRLCTPYEVRDVQNLVQLLIDPLGLGLPDHWERTGSQAFEALILHTLYLGRQPTLAGVANLLFDPQRAANATIDHLMSAEHDPTGALGWDDAHGNPTRTHPLVAGGMRGLLDLAEKERSSVISEVKGFLGLYRDPVVAANTAVSDFRIDDLVNHRRPLSLYIDVVVADQERMKPLLRLMLAQILNRLTERLEYRDGRAVPAGKRPLLLMIDEFPSLGRLDMFANSLSLIAGYGIKACLIAQSMTQIYKAYGHDETISSNCDTRVAFAPNGMETARLLSQMTGQTTVRHTHRTVSNSGVTVSEPEVGRPLLTPDEATRLGSNDALIFANGQPVIRAYKLRHYRHRLFRQLVKIRPPQVSDRIEHAAQSAVGSSLACESKPEPSPVVASTAPTSTPNLVAAKTQNQPPAPVEQLSFLKSAVENTNGADNAPAKKDAKERLL